MKKILITVLGLLCATSLVVNAQDAKPAKKTQTAEQKALQKEMLEKYDTNKNGKLDKAEKAKISKEDKARMEKAGLIRKAKARKSTETPATPAAPAATPAPATTPAPAAAPAATPGQ